MGHRSSKSASANSTTSADLYKNNNNSTIDLTTNTTAVTPRRPTELWNSTVNSSNHIPIPLTGTTINVQIQESPTTADVSTVAAGTATKIVASSSNRLSGSNSSSLASLTGSSLQNRQIIIKIQLAKMENGNESHQQEVAEASANDTNSLESNYSQNPTATQFVNLTVKGNIYYTNEGTTEIASLSSNSSRNSRTAGGSTNLNNNNNTNKTTTGNTSIEYSLNSLHIQEDWEQQQANDALPDYCEVLEDSVGSSLSAHERNDNRRSDASLSDTVGCLNSRRKTKALNRPTSSSSTASSSSSGMLSKRRCREAIRRILEPATKSSNNKNKEHNKKHSGNSTATPPLPPLPTCSTVLPSTTSNRNDARTQTQSLNQMQPNLTTTAATTANLMPISITTVGGASNIGNTNSGVAVTTATANANQLPTAIWTPSHNDLIIPITSPPQFVVVQCAPSSVVTLGRIDDNAIRLTSTDVGNVNSFNVNSVRSNGFTATTNLTRAMLNGPIVHSQVDFVHCLVPDLDRIVNSSFYWGKIDRYEAERLLEGKPEGTFLLRDSAQEEYLFSVTFRKYSRSLHARIEQSGHKFGFDCHDPGVFTAPTVTGLLQHYKDPTCVMFFEPMLTIPLHRKTVFSLQELSRATIVSNTTYDGINELGLPVRVKSFLKEYHYKQKLRVKPCDEPFYACT